MEYTAVFTVIVAAILWGTTVLAVPATDVTSRPVAVDVNTMSIDSAKRSVQSTQKDDEEDDDDEDGDDDDDDDDDDDEDDEDDEDAFVLEMLAVAKAMTANDAKISRRLVKALQSMDDTEKGAAELSDRTFYAYLKLYPAWLSYAQDADPATRAHKFTKYAALLGAYNKHLKDLIDAMGMLISMQKVLLPSNVLPDPDRRILPEVNIAKVLEALKS